MRRALQVFRSGGGRIISFQLWTWREETDIYDLEHFQVHEGADGARTTERRTAAYRAYTRAALSAEGRIAGTVLVASDHPPDTLLAMPKNTTSARLSLRAC